MDHECIELYDTSAISRLIIYTILVLGGSRRSVCSRYLHRRNLAVGGHVNGSVALESILAPPEGSCSL